MRGASTSMRLPVVLFAIATRSSMLTARTAGRFGCDVLLAEGEAQAKPPS